MFHRFATTLNNSVPHLPLKQQRPYDLLARMKIVFELVQLNVLWVWHTNLSAQYTDLTFVLWVRTVCWGVALCDTDSKAPTLFTIRSDCIPLFYSYSYLPYTVASSRCVVMLLQCGQWCLMFNIKPEFSIRITHNDRIVINHHMSVLNPFLA